MTVEEYKTELMAVIDGVRRQRGQHADKDIAVMSAKKQINSLSKGSEVTLKIHPNTPDVSVCWDKRERYVTLSKLTHKKRRVWRFPA
jgi:hypothetical protein